MGNCCGPGVFDAGAEVASGGAAGFPTAFVTYAVATLLTAADMDKLVNGNAAGGGFSLTLPAAAANGLPKTVAVRKLDSTANVVTILPAGADTIEGNASYLLKRQGESLWLASDGVSAWRVVSGVQLPTSGDLGAVANQVPVTLSTDGRTLVDSPMNIAADTTLKMDAAGNARGSQARDWQVSRAAVTQVASGIRSAIINGQNNTAGNDDALCGGGQDINVATLDSIGLGGGGHTVGVGAPGGGEHAAVGGDTNAVGSIGVSTLNSGNFCGQNNIVKATNAVNCGGNGNEAGDALAIGGQNAFNGGGFQNKALQKESGNIGGAFNIVGVGVKGEQGFNGGGLTNTVKANAGANVGGELNVVGNAVAGQSKNAANVGGTLNVPTGQNAFNGGGNGNTPGGLNAATVGGHNNAVSGDDSAVLAGHNNTLSAPDSALVGPNNSITGVGDGAFVVGAQGLAERPGEFVIGGNSTTAAGDAQSGTLVYRRTINAGVALELPVLGVAGEFLNLIDGDLFAVSAQATARASDGSAHASWFPDASNRGQIWREAGVTAGQFAGAQTPTLTDDAPNFSPTLELAADVANDRLNVIVDNTSAVQLKVVVEIHYVKRSG